MSEHFVLSLENIEDCLFKGKSIDVNELPMDRVQECFDFR
jgi:hypothetical protein